MLSHLMFSTAYEGKYFYYFSFRAEETEVHRGEISCPNSFSEELVEPEFKHRTSASRILAANLLIGHSCLAMAYCGLPATCNPS